ncbi:MAG: hypothetical protein JWO69_380 [Thermoleophilia bacterium]|jgi:cytoplasmic iron level regulating protein YaaA (DUF328/UPF0246 family)|nr:hypothetical protein [Thermoleophilia bacterium]
MRHHGGMLILLPPSETKADGGDGAPLDLDALSWGELAAPRERVAKALVKLAERPKAAGKALGLGPTQLDEVERNLELLDAATMPAIERYTGVLYDALDIGSLTGETDARARRRLAIGSALFGLVRADDAIPAYRLSATSKLPRIGGLAPVWKPHLTPLLEGIVARELLVDLRSGAYQALAPARGAVTVRVLNERADGARSVVSHFNKATKGRIARVLASSPDRHRHSVRDVVKFLRADGLEVEHEAERPLHLDVILRE